MFEYISSLAQADDSTKRMIKHKYLRYIINELAPELKEYYDSKRKYYMSDTLVSMLRKIIDLALLFKPNDSEIIDLYKLLNKPITNESLDSFLKMLNQLAVDIHNMPLNLSTNFTEFLRHVNSPYFQDFIKMHGCKIFILHEYKTEFRMIGTMEENLFYDKLYNHFPNLKQFDKYFVYSYSI